MRGVVLEAKLSQYHKRRPLVTVWPLRNVPRLAWQ